MLHLIQPTWQLSVVGAALLALLSIVLAPARSTAARLVVGFSREFTLVLLAMAGWQRVGVYAHSFAGGARETGRAIHAFELAIGLPDEVSVQQFSLHVPGLMQLLIAYYDLVHLNSMAIFLVWMWWQRHREYSTARWALIFSTVACFLIQIRPVAPPRMFTDLGFIDIALQYGQSVYGNVDAGSNQLAAMPSIHMDWAVIVGVFFWRNGPRGWRWLGAAHIVMTLWAIVATANHWWSDAAVAVGLVIVAVPLAHLTQRGTARAAVALRSWLRPQAPRWSWPYLGIEDPAAAPSTEAVAARGRAAEHRPPGGPGSGPDLGPDTRPDAAAALDGADDPARQSVVDGV